MSLPSETLSSSLTREQGRKILDHLSDIRESTEQQIYPELQLIQLLIKTLNSKMNIKDLVKEPDYIMNEFLPTSIKHLTNSRSFRNKEITELINSIIEECMVFIVKNLEEDNLKMAETLKNILECNKLYYKWNNAEESTFYSESLIQKNIPEIDNLEVGALVDAIKVDSINKRVIWAPAKIIDIRSGHLKLSYLYENPVYDRYIDENKNELRSYKSKTGADFIWRKALQPGDIIDCMDTNNVWYNSTVLDRREKIKDDKEIIEISIGFRIYDEKGDSYDSFQSKRYFGLSTSFDEWLSISSPRIMPKKIVLKALDSNKYNNRHDSDLIFDDSNDLIYEYKDIYSVTRSSYRSLFIMKLINNFGELKGFEKILNRIQDTNKWCNIDILSTYVDIISNVNPMLFREFALDYLPKLKKAIFNCILQGPSQNIRNYSKERLDVIISGLKTILRRIHGIGEQSEIIEKFSLDLAYLCFNSEYLERKLQGLKALMELMKDVKYRMSRINYLTIDQLNTWINEKQIFENLYGAKSHPQLMQRSSDFFKFMLSEDLIKSENLNLIWTNLRKGDIELRMNLYKLIAGATISLNKSHIDFFMDKYNETPLIQLCKEDIDLIMDLIKYVSKNNMVIDIYWKVICELNNEVGETALLRLCDLLRGWDLSEKRIIVLMNCVDNIENNKAVVFTIRIIKKLIEGYALSSNIDEYTRSFAIDKLCNEKKLIEVLLNNLRMFKQKVRELTNETDEKNIDLILSDRIGYYAHIQERISLFQFLFTNSQQTLTFEILANLWEECISNYILTNERNLMYKLFQESSKSSLFKTTNLEIIRKFFNEKMCSSEKDIEELTNEGFLCFKSIFCLVNEKIDKLVCVNKDDEEKETFYQGGITNSLYSTTTYSYSYRDNSKKKLEFDYQSKCSPLEMEGIINLWNIITLSKLEQVSQNSSELLLNLFKYLYPGMKTIDINTQFLSFLFNNLSNIYNNQNSLQIQRTITLLQSFIELSEDKGVGTLISHGALIPGESLILSFYNDLNWGSDIPKQFELTLKSNYTILNLRKLIGKEIKTAFEEIKINRNSNNTVISNDKNGRTIASLQIRSREEFKITRQEIPEIPRVSILNPDRSLTNLAEKAFRRWFSEFSTNGKMTCENLARFRESCLCEKIDETDSKIRGLIKRWGDNDNDYLTENNFIEFYRDAAINTESVVWKNLKSHGYRNDLMKAYEVEDNEKILENQMTRFILANNQDFFAILFGFLESDNISIADSALALLNDIPTGTVIYSKIIEIAELEKSPDWDIILDINKPHKTFYILELIEYLLQSDKTTEKEKLWKDKFISLGGLKHLIKIFHSFSLKKISSLDKKTLGYLIRIFKELLFSKFLNKIPDFDLYMSFLDSNTQISLEMIALKLIKDNQMEIEIEENNIDIEIFDFKNFLCEINTYVMNILENSDGIDVDECRIIESGLEMELGIILYDNETITYFQSVLENNLTKGLFSPRSVNIRRIFSHFLFILSKKVYYIYNNSDLQKKIVSSLLNNISKGIKQEYCDESYELLCKMIEELLSDSASDNEFIDIDLVVEHIIKSLISHKSQEKNSSIEDKTLIGLLKLSDKFIRINQSIKDKYGCILIEELFCKSLFCIGSKQNYLPKCLSKESRNLSYMLLSNICKKSPKNISFLIEKGLIELLSYLPKTSNQTTNSNYYDSSSRSIYGYVGIRNLGCICYMNAMLQQFYMTPVFRYFLLMANDNKPIKLECSKDNKSYDDNILHQMQRLFAFLELSDRQDYNPYGFCCSFKDSQGNSVNVSIQQDAQEFLNMIFDKLENGLKGSPFSDILLGVYGGKTCTQLICGGCGNKKQLEENFYNVSLEVKNLKNLYESLDKYVTGETISDYKCEACNTKQDILKKCSLSILPNVLIIHLQRIVFDLDTLQNEKINSRLEFPFSLDLNNYTLDFIENKEVNSDSIYKLVGVVVHTGTAQYGHYYSYINTLTDRQNKSPKDNFDDKWLEFNDSTIRDFDPKNIENECFGGNETSSNDDWGMGWNKDRENSKNAYILIYEREKKQKVRLISDDNGINELKNILKGEEEIRPDGKKNFWLDFNGVRPYVSQELAKDVWEDNYGYILEKNLYSDQFFKFINEIILSIKLPDSTTDIYSKGFETQYLDYSEEDRNSFFTMIEILMKIICDMLAKSMENGLLNEFNEILKKLLFLCPDYLTKNFDRLISTKNHAELLILSSDRTVRNNYSQLLLTSLNIMISFNNLTLKREDSNDLNIQIMNQLDKILEYIPKELNKSNSKIQQYFEFWRDFAYSGQKQILFMIEKQIITLFLDYLLEAKSPLTSASAEKKAATSSTFSYKIPSEYLDPLVQTISFLAIRLIPRNGLISNFLIGEGIKMSKMEEIILYDINFYERALKDSLDSRNVCQLIEHLSYEDEQFSLKISILILKNLNKLLFDDIQSYMEVVTTILNIKDSYQMSRCEWLLGYPQFEVVSTVNSMDNYGLYGIGSLDDTIITYQSSLFIEGCTTILNLMIKNINRSESICIICLKCILLLADLNQNIYDYIIDLPTPNYLWARFNDWFYTFLEKYKTDCNKYYYSDSKKKSILEESFRLYSNFTEKLYNTYPNLSKPIDEVYQNNLPMYLIGQTVKETQIFEFKNEDYTISIKELNFFIMPSLPTGKTNLSIPKTIARDQYIYQSSVDSSSVFSCFLYSKYAYPESSTSKMTSFISRNSAKLSKYVSSFFNLNFGKEKKEEKEAVPIINEKINTDEKINTENIEENSFENQTKICNGIRKFRFENKSKNYYLMVYQIIGKNIRSFNSPFYYFAGPNTINDFFILNKINFDLEWEEYKFIHNEYLIKCDCLDELNVLIKYFENKEAKEIVLESKTNYKKNVERMSEERRTRNRQDNDYVMAIDEKNEYERYDIPGYY